MPTIRLTMAQALTRWMAAQSIRQFDGSTKPAFTGVWAIFGHGNVAGLGEALHAVKDQLPTFRGHNEQTMAHSAIAYAKQLAKDALKSKGKRKKVLVNLSGRGDKDLFILAQSLGGSAWEQFLDSELQRLKGDAL